MFNTFNDLSLRYSSSPKSVVHMFRAMFAINWYVAPVCTIMSIIIKLNTCNLESTKACELFTKPCKDFANVAGIVGKQQKFGGSQHYLSV